MLNSLYDDIQMFERMNDHYIGCDMIEKCGIVRSLKLDGDLLYQKTYLLTKI